MPWVAMMIAVVITSGTVALFVATPEDDFVYEFDPDPLPVSSGVTSSGVPVSGEQCFSTDHVYTVTSETWAFADGESLRPDGFDPFYSAPATTIEYGGSGIPLDSSNCSAFVDFPQVPPPRLTTHLEANCEATPRMIFRLNAQAIDAVTGRASDIVIRSSEPFQFPERC